MKNFNPNEIIPILESNEVEFAGIFGSYAKEKNKEDSDIDILVRFAKPKSLIKIIGLERKLSEKLNKKIDLVTEKSLSPYIKEEVFNTLQPIYGER